MGTDNVLIDYLFVKGIDFFELIVSHGLGHLVADVINSGLEVFLDTHDEAVSRSKDSWTRKRNMRNDKIEKKN